MTNDREAHLLDRVRDTAKRCIDLGVRVDTKEDVEDAYDQGYKDGENASHDEGDWMKV
jgi:hypothetical protein